MNKKMFRILIAWLLVIAVVILMTLLSGCTKDKFSAELVGHTFYATNPDFPNKKMSFSFSEKEVEVRSNFFLAPVSTGTWKWSVDSDQLTVYGTNFSTIFTINKNNTFWYSHGDRNRYSIVK